ncbi:hypothetical protein L1887_55309 [Cichorium endivia]|nr:hypothetical protein L1887_55309 [Cichorium endivia]
MRTSVVSIGFCLFFCADCNADLRLGARAGCGIRVREDNSVKASTAIGVVGKDIAFLRLVPGRIQSSFECAPSRCDRAVARGELTFGREWLWSKGEVDAARATLIKRAISSRRLSDPQREKKKLRAAACFSSPPSSIDSLHTAAEERSMGMSSLFSSCFGRRSGSVPLHETDSDAPAGRRAVDSVNPAKCAFCNVTPDRFKIILEDAELICFRDRSPAAAVHLQVIPRMHIANVQSLGPHDTDLVRRMHAFGTKALDLLQSQVQSQNAGLDGASKGSTASGA